MNAREIIFFVLGILCLTESIWALLKPAFFKNEIAKICRETPESYPYIGSFLIAIGVILGMLAFHIQPSPDWPILIIGLLLLIKGAFWCTPKIITRLLNWLLIEASLTGIRIRYTIVFVVGVVLIGLAMFYSGQTIP